ncbi:MULTISPECIES: ethanolamine ammonia-lyase subunit EutB [unclassified Pseudofrankia]|uniref:ethanolamine ammonia-lyase subunit EutB n=1 Tax=unclassified Pseudofrankia TaxID=2994372 RepID=UPI0008D8FAE1|nr:MULTISPECIES: ethanolamine ammonia-lyase subunit EutB [unclassified Pseudofrankia]MDT3439970.1 ethanolamine ammonia-lyase subunit EutB [Pseudofrankia sp. BMG5.37]OHV48430.1 ethanolamine ammonia-lyase [Pseudofrankia sp. BMG5.36]
MAYRATVRGERFVFADLREVMAKANEEKSGDQLAEIAAGSARERVAAKLALADVPLSEIVANPLVDDAVTDLILASHDTVGFQAIAACTIGEFREMILAPGFPETWAAGGLARAVTPEIAAAVAKIMSDRDLITGAKPLRTATRCRNTMGGPGVLGVRTQPNHPTDDVEGILLSAVDGLLYGCGDAMIGVNPAAESVTGTAAILRGLAGLIDHLHLPTQTCVLAHLTTQLAALDAGAPVDLLFQSVAGTEEANRSFGISLDLLAEGREAVLAHHRTRAGQFVGEQVMYFETGQGSALSADAHHSIDQLTVEARAHGVARAYDPFLVNSVVGFIGPEYLADARQIIRAGLEDHFVGKLLGLPMGIDVCYTNHVEADQNTNDDLFILLAAAGCTFVMGVPASDDVMLGYQSTSYHDAAGIRELFGLSPAPEFTTWLTEKGLLRDGRLTDPAGQLAATLAGGLDAALLQATPSAAIGTHHPRRQPGGAM